MSFRSDNGAMVAPEIFNALQEANTSDPGGYCNDPYCKAAEAKIQEIFEAPQAKVFFTATGTAANSLALASLVRPYASVMCHKLSHINEDECGAPEFYTNGAKLITLPGENAKIDIEALKASMSITGALGVHNVQKGALSLTNITETGAAYTFHEMQERISLAKSNNMRVHLDGARLANALVSTKMKPCDIINGVDIAVLGGTKNGLLGGEAVIVFDDAIADEFAFFQKRGGHLYSKGGFYGAQFNAYLQNNNWLNWAENANNQMKLLVKALSEIGITPDNQPDANMLFVKLPRKTHKKLFDAGFKYYLMPADATLIGEDDELIGARFVTSWNTSDEEINEFVNSL